LGKQIYKTVRIKGESYLKLKKATSSGFIGLGELLDHILISLSQEDYEKYVKELEPKFSFEVA
jgi:hypothetical protein